jgi:hypothetical protein
MANSKSERQYVALTTQGSGYWVVVMGEPGETREAVEERASRQICGDQWDQAKDIYVDTQLKNLQIHSLSAAKRAFPKALRHYEESIEWGEAL